MNSKDSTIVILSQGKVFGPFPDQETATGYIKTNPLPTPELYSMWSAATGTTEEAHECGVRLASIEEETRRPHRKASGA